MAPGTEGGVRKSSRGYYHNNVQKLQAVVEAKLQEIAALDAAREQMAEREQVLVDLVLQQEHHLSHLEQMKASLDADMANLDMLLSMDTDTPDVTAVAAGNSCTPGEAARSIGGISTDSAAACSTGIESNPCSGASHSSGFSGVAPALAQMQPWRQQQQQQVVQQPQLQLQVQQWQHGSTHAGSDCGSDTPMGASTGSVLDSGNRQQYIQSLMQAATDTDWARAMTMTATDWCTYQGRLVARLKIVLELRQQKRQQQQQGALELEVVALPQAQRSAYAAALLNGGDGAVPERLLDPDVEMVALIDDFNTLVNLSILHNPMPVRDCARRNNATLEYQDVVPLEFWAAATAKTGFTEEQLQQLRIGYSEWWRIMGQVHSKQQQLATSVASSTAASAPKPWGMRGGAAGAAAAAAAAATAPAQERDDLLHLLDEHMARWQTAAQLLLQFYCNTMTHEQCANMNVACWPYFPRMGSLVGALAEANHPGAFDRMEAQMQQLRAQHTAQANRRKQQLAQQRQDYWRRLVVLREQQALQQQALQAVAAQQQQLQQQQQFVVKPPVSMGLQF